MNNNISTDLIRNWQTKISSPICSALLKSTYSIPWFWSSFYSTPKLWSSLCSFCKLPGSICSFPRLWSSWSKMEHSSTVRKNRIHSRRYTWRSCSTISIQLFSSWRCLKHFLQFEPIDRCTDLATAFHTSGWLEGRWMNGFVSARRWWKNRGQGWTERFLLPQCGFHQKVPLLYNVQQLCLPPLRIPCQLQYCTTWYTSTGEFFRTCIMYISCCMYSVYIILYTI